MAGKKQHLKDKDGKIIGATYHKHKSGYTFVDMTNVEKAQKAEREKRRKKKAMFSKIKTIKGVTKAAAKMTKNIRKYHNNDYEEGK